MEARTKYPREREREREREKEKQRETAIEKARLVTEFFFSLGNSLLPPLPLLHFPTLPSLVSRNMTLSTAPGRGNPVQSTYLLEYGRSTYCRYRSLVVRTWQRARSMHGQAAPLALLRFTRPTPFPAQTVTSRLRTRSYLVRNTVL